MDKTTLLAELEKQTEHAAYQIVARVVGLDNSDEGKAEQIEIIAEAASSFVRWIDTALDMNGFDLDQADTVLLAIEKAATDRLALKD